MHHINDSYVIQSVQICLLPRSNSGIDTASKKGGVTYAATSLNFYLELLVYAILQKPNPVDSVI